ncbi:hypothetical protein SB717_39325, partial [Priestia sp. SIMBA_032]|uniref:hypothetical protein n=1 Tax=Priestia sp. SIMBA_032 TaxID=3085775 RepID=UPI003979B1A0
RCCRRFPAAVPRSRRCPRHRSRWSAIAGSPRLCRRYSQYDRGNRPSRQSGRRGACAFGGVPDGWPGGLERGPQRPTSK